MSGALSSVVGVGGATRDGPGCTLQTPSFISHQFCVHLKYANIIYESPYFPYMKYKFSARVKQSSSSSIVKARINVVKTKAMFGQW